jgi:N-formylglutamate amidohydrolase
MLDERAIRSSEDAFMDLLVDAAPGLGAPLLAAEYARGPSSTSTAATRSSIPV